jgi:zinc transporter, ZIP family
MEIFGPLLMSGVAGLATCLGIVFTYINPKDKDKFIAISLSFAMGVMVLISIKELIPIPLKFILIAYKLPYNVLIALIMPLFALTMVNYTNKKINSDDSLYRVGILNMMILMIHNIPEGIATFISGMANPTLGIKLTMAIMAHNIPEGICICVPIYYATKNRSKAFFYTFIAGIAEPLGAILMYTIFKNYINMQFLNTILYFIGSLMITISLKELLPEILSYNNKSWLLLGLALSLFILLL